MKLLTLAAASILTLGLYQNCGKSMLIGGEPYEGIVAPPTNAVIVAPASGNSSSIPDHTAVTVLYDCLADDKGGPIVSAQIGKTSNGQGIWIRGMDLAMIAFAPWQDLANPITLNVQTGSQKMLAASFEPVNMKVVLTLENLLTGTLQSQTLSCQFPQK